MCCGCKVLTCCGIELKKGVTIWGVVEGCVNILLGLLFIMNEAVTGNGNFVNVLMGFMLAVAAHIESTCLIIVWLVWAMINIVIYFILWITLPFLVLGAAFLGAVSEACQDGIEGDGFTHVEDCEEVQKGTGILVLIILWIIICPILYTYMWIVVNSFRQQIQINKVMALQVVQPNFAQPTMIGHGQQPYGGPPPVGYPGGQPAAYPMAMPPPVKF